MATVANIKVEPQIVYLGGSVGAGSEDGVDLGCVEGDISFGLSEEVLDKVLSAA